MTGDNRDGDEQWYQYRTQEFCANAAYSLYGAKKGDLSVFGCTRGHFINSFFTYAGADNLLLAAGMEPIVYYNNNGEKGNNAGTNAQCQEIENENGGNRENNRQNREGEGDNNNHYMSTMGCDAEGNYVIAGFSANNCDGNYYSGQLDPFTEYNKQHQKLGCHRMYSPSHQDFYSLSYLLNNSWSCDLDMYPNGCPDPYGKKERQAFALRVVANGGNAELAYRNMVIKGPLRFLGSVLLIIALGALVLGYKMRNQDRIASKGGKTAGYLRCLWDDFVEALIAAKEATVMYMRTYLENTRNEKEHVDEEFSEPEAQVSKREKTTKKKKKKAKRSKADESAWVFS